MLLLQNIGENSRISLSWYLGEDNIYNWEELALEALWKNNTISVNYMHMFNKQLKTEFLIAKSRFDIVLGFATNASEGIVEEDFKNGISFKIICGLFSEIGSLYNNQMNFFYG